MKRILIFVIVGLVMFGVGFGGGLIFGRMNAPKDTNEVGQGRVIPNPGPIVSIGQFTSNLAGSGHHVLDCTLSLELIDKEGATALVQSPGWMNRIRSEVFMLIRDRLYDDISSREGLLNFAGDIKRTLNEMLPDVGKEAPVINVTFDSIIIQ